jgi:hypothetical protein
LSCDSSRQQILFRTDAVSGPGQWVGATRFVFNIGLEQRIDAWRKGVRLDYNKQAKELTACREMVGLA